MDYILSIIIPVYNVEKYLKRCIMSILGLSVQKAEIILVDDGSSDLSGKLCDDFSNRYDNIKVFHKCNGGVVSARNVGLRVAGGKYVTFVDADDWVRAEFFSEALERLENEEEIDVVIGRMVRAANSEELKPIFPKEHEECILMRENAKDALFKREYFGWELCGKIYKKYLFDGWKADESIKICEDLDSNWEVFNRVHKVLYMPSDFYYYFWNDKSATNEYLYLDSKSYLAFEKILNSKWELSVYAYEMIKDNYEKRLINLIRESYYHKKGKKEIERYQEKLKRICGISQTDNNQGLCAMYSGYQETLNYLDEFKEYLKNTFEEIYYSYKDVYYWGTGAVSDYISRITSQLGFHCRGYIVSEGELKKVCFYGKKVSYLTNVETKEKAAVILLIKKEFQEEVFKNLQNNVLFDVFKIDTRGIV